MTTTPRVRRSSPTSRRRCCRQGTGAAWACIPAAISKAGGAPAPGRNGWRCTAIPTSRISTAATARRCRSGSSATSSRARAPAGSSSRRCRSMSAIPARRFVLRAENEWPLARTQWTKYFLQPDGLGLGTEAPVSETTLSYETTGDGLTFRTPPLTRPSRDHRPGGGEAVAVVADRRRRPFPGAAGVRSRRQGGGVRRLQRSARAGGTGLAARLPSQARSAAHAAVSAMAHPRRGMAADAGRAGRARHRDLADLDRGAAGLSHRAHCARQGL